MNKTNSTPRATEKIQMFPISRQTRVLCLAGFLAALSGCISNPPSARPAAPVNALNFNEGLQYAVNDLFTQVKNLPAFQGPVIKLPGVNNPKPLIVLDATVEAATGQKTAATQTLDAQLLTNAAARFETFAVQPVSPEGLQKAQYVLAGSLVPAGSDVNRARTRINLSITEIRSGLVVAQTAVLLSGQGVDATPTAFFRDSPALTKDRVVDGQIKTSQTSAGSAADALYLDRLPVAALVNEALNLYEARNYSQALRYYQQAASRPEGQQMRVFNGLYLTQMQLGDMEAASKSFSRIVALGLSGGNLSIKFLFEPGKTDFIADPKIRGPYPMWIKMLAQETVNSSVCLRIVGHTSRTGTDSYNDRLSLQRATAVQKDLSTAAPELRTRLSVDGRGSRDPLVGSGTDDMRDAVDRRVDFNVVGC